jgi:hypothetical protein
MGNKKIFFATNGHNFPLIQMTGKFYQIKIQKTMKKISLEMLRLSSDDVLERSQMKKITGGYGGGGGGCSYGRCDAATTCCDPHIYWCSGASGYCTKR